MKTVLKIGLDALPNAELARFTALFPVAETRTQVAWVRVRPVDADVVVCHRQPWRATRAVTLCIDPIAVRGADTELVPLERGFRVLTLMAALDRAALQVLARRWQRGRPASVARRLSHWVQARAVQLAARQARLVAALSRRAVARDWMARSGSLSFAEVDELLSELREHGAWADSGAEPLVWLPAKPCAPQRQLPSRLLDWLRLWRGAKRAA
jgi:hypothetical protein